MTLFCDFDGPIVDVSGRYHSTYRLALARTRRFYGDRGLPLSLTPLTKVQFWRLKQMRTPDPAIARRSGLQGEQVSFFLDQVQQIVNSCPTLLRRDQLQPQVPGALALLRRHGITLVLVTLRCEQQVQAFLSRHGLEDAFAAIYGTQDSSAAYANYSDLKTALLGQAIADHSPTALPPLGATAGLAAGLAASSAPLSAWMVGDTEADVIAAQRLGLPAIALSCGIRSRDYLASLKPTAIQPNLLVLAQGISRAIAEGLPVAA